MRLLIHVLSSEQLVESGLEPPSIHNTITAREVPKKQVAVPRNQVAAPDFRQKLVLKVCGTINLELALRNYFLFSSAS